MIAVREQLLLETLTIAADTLVDDFDIVDFLHVLVERSSDICEAVDVGILFAEPKGELVVMAATSERLRVIEALQLSTGQGPSLDSYDSGEVVTAGSVDEIARRWPDFAPGVTELGYQSVHAVPLRLRRRTIGSLDFFRDACGELSAEDVRSAQTIADIATIGSSRSARSARRRSPATSCSTPSTPGC
ncbi:GAF domain-containing protein [Rathayibacter sp. VKM Ac-2754]|uniref:GAF domain-containing protein n=1 Tax=Rathayibacter sp. VKM Ac-2754 TaxID=2609251 RepID=UPI00135AB3ED|nr:GAF domain-containing protein [Rathayibacter sp. VKM Ac-2754]MWV57740.1 GAF domain-containing protein [Rathayibacter sp. VKM Ac-2754]